MIDLLHEHGSDLLWQAQARREGLGILTEDEAEVDVEEMALGSDLQVVEMPIANAQHLE